MGTGLCRWGCTFAPVCRSVNRMNGAEHLEQNPDFEHAASLRRICPAGAEHRTRCRIAGSDVGNLGTSKEDLVLISRCKRYRPGVTAGAVEKIGCAIGKAAG